MSALRSPIRSALFAAIRAVICPPLIGGGGGLWDPRQWFTNGEEGTWFDLSPPDLENLDLGPELNPQVDFNAVGAWVVGSNMSISGGSLNADTNWTTGQSTFLPVLDNLKLYLLEFTVINFVGTGTFQVSASNVPSPDGVINVSGNGTYRAVIRNNSASAPVRLRVGNVTAAGYSMSIDRLSCKEVLGGYEPVLFQDAAGQVLVNQVEQPLGLIVDKSGSGNNIPQATAARRPAWSARKNFLVGSAVLATQNVTVAPAEYTLSHTGAGTIVLSGAGVGSLVGPGSLTFTTTAGALTLTVSGAVTDAQLEFGRAVTRYQRVNTATDYDAAGFPHYARGDGVDDEIAREPANMSYPAFSHVQCGSTQNVIPNAFVGPGLWFGRIAAHEGAQIFVQENLGVPATNPCVVAQIFGTPNNWAFTPRLDGLKYYMPDVHMGTFDSNAQTLRADSFPVVSSAFPYAPISSPADSYYGFFGGNQWCLYDAVTINRILTDADYQKYKTYALAKSRA